MAGLCTSQGFLDVFPSVSIRTEFDCARPLLCDRRNNGARLASLGNEDFFSASNPTQDFAGAVLKLFG